MRQTDNSSVNFQNMINIKNYAKHDSHEHLSSAKQLSNKQLTQSFGKNITLKKISAHQENRSLPPIISHQPMSHERIPIKSRNDAVNGNSQVQHIIINPVLLSRVPIPANSKTINHPPTLSSGASSSQYHPQSLLFSQEPAVGAQLKPLITRKGDTFEE
jgi:hypothetical protein